MLAIQVKKALVITVKIIHMRVLQELQEVEENEYRRDVESLPLF